MELELDEKTIALAQGFDWASKLPKALVLNLVQEMDDNKDASSTSFIPFVKLSHIRRSAMHRTKVVEKEYIVIELPIGGWSHYIQIDAKGNCKFVEPKF